MNIVHIGSHDNTGGAARAAFRLHTGLKSAGCQSSMVVGWKRETGDEIDSVVPVGSMRQKISSRLFIKIDKLLSLQHLYSPWSRTFLRHPFVRSADVINLHNLNGGYISHRILPRLGQIAPIVWTFHGMWGMTGHCSFAYDCQRWKTGCGRCPDLSDDPALTFDTTALLWRIKRRVYESTQMTVVTPSKWLSGLASESPLVGQFDIHTIPNGLDLDTFKPVPQSAARRTLGLPEDAKVIMFAAHQLFDRRKGGAYLLDALRQLGQSGQEKIWLLTVGSGTLDPERETIPFPVQNLGHISSDHILAACYSAADVLVAPSLAESFGQVFSESMACGTPCVAFDTTAVSEVVRHMETGYLAPLGDADGLAQGIQLLLENDELRARMAAKCRRVAEDEYSITLQTRRYMEVYEEVASRRKSLAGKDV